MDVREKLVEIVKSAAYHCLPSNTQDFHINMFVTDLLAHGVTVLPLKIGDVVYFPIEDYHDSAIVDGINIDKQGISFTWVQYEVGVDVTELWDDGEFDIDEIGKTVFLTREEAEPHLPEPPKGETIYCKDCEHLMFSDCYGECAKGHKGIVNPNDTCEHAKRKLPKGE